MMSKFKLIVGLGNFGEKYQNNRHNLGFLILDNLIYPEKFEYNAKNNAYIFKKDGVIYAKPKSYMNTSGEEVAKLASFFQIKTEEILIIHDEIDLDFQTRRALLDDFLPLYGVESKRVPFCGGGQHLGSLERTW